MKDGPQFWELFVHVLTSFLRLKRVKDDIIRFDSESKTGKSTLVRSDRVFGPKGRQIPWKVMTYPSVFSQEVSQVVYNWYI